MDLPEGLTARPLRHGAEAAVTSVMAAQELHDTGEVVIEEADIVADWHRPSMDLATSTIGVFDGDELVAYAELQGQDRGDAAVLPSYRGRGIGTQLARWMQRTGRARGSRVVGMPVPEGSPGDRLLAALGYHVRWTSWVLELPESRTILAQPVPSGYVVRQAAPEDYRACWTVIEDAFLEWSVREREPFEDFAAGVMGRPGFQPWMLRVVTGPSGTVVGAALVLLAGERGEEGYVDRLAVGRDHRNRGLARALLADAFAAAREHGARRSTLATDSRTGALSLYEKVGMEVTSVWVNRGLEL